MNSMRQGQTIATGARICYRENSSFLPDFGVSHGVCEVEMVALLRHMAGNASGQLRPG